MSTAFYIVILSHDQWWVDLEGRTTGPFSSMEVAMAGAVSMAETAARAGRRTEVHVSAPGHHNRVVYRSQAQSALGRAAARAALATL
jgi:hypothetical protein